MLLLDSKIDKKKKKTIRQASAWGPKKYLSIILISGPFIPYC